MSVDEEQMMSKFDPRHRKPHGDVLALRKAMVGTCQKCGGHGHIDEIACSCMLEMLSICGLDKADCPREYWERNLHDFTSQQANEFAVGVDEYKANHRDWRKLNKLITGPYRRGKTTYAVAAMKRYMHGRDDITAAYITSNQLLTVRNDKDGGKFDLSYLGALDLLIIDEIGKEPENEWHKPKFVDALDILLRLRRGNRSTILISNFSLIDLGTKYGENLRLILTNDFDNMKFDAMPLLGMR
jgi:DNA replication protein DnaC